MWDILIYALGYRPVIAGAAVGWWLGGKKRDREG